MSDYLKLTLAEVWAGAILWKAGYPYHGARVWAVKPLTDLSREGFTTCCRSVVTQDMGLEDPSTVARFQLAMEQWKLAHGQLNANNIAMCGWFAQYVDDMVLDHDFRTTRMDDGQAIKSYVVDDVVYTPLEFFQGKWWTDTIEKDNTSSDGATDTRELSADDAILVERLEALLEMPEYEEGASKIKRVVRLIRSKSTMVDSPK